MICVYSVLWTSGKAVSQQNGGVGSMSSLLSQDFVGAAGPAPAQQVLDFVQSQSVFRSRWR